MPLNILNWACTSLIQLHSPVKICSKSPTRGILIPGRLAHWILPKEIYIPSVADLTKMLHRECGTLMNTYSNKETLILIFHRGSVHYYWIFLLVHNLIYQYIKIKRSLDISMQFLNIHHSSFCMIEIPDQILRAYKFIYM